MIFSHQRSPIERLEHSFATKRQTIPFDFKCCKLAKFLVLQLCPVILLEVAMSVCIAKR